MTSMTLPAIGDNLGRYLGELKKFPLLTREEEFELAKRWKDTKDVKSAHALVTANLRFVVKIANEYKGYGLKLIELIQEGNVGLMQGIKRFDPDRGFRLVSFAVHWIRAYIHQYIMRSLSVVRMGAGRAQRKLFYKLGEIRALLNKGVDDRDSARREMAERLKVDVVEIEEVEARLVQPDISVDAPLGDEGHSLVNTLTDGTDNVEEQVAEAELHQRASGSLHKAMGHLGTREREIVQARFLQEDPPALQVLGEHYGISRERVRQLEARALQKLRKLLDGDEAATMLAAFCA